MAFIHEHAEVCYRKINLSDVLFETISCVENCLFIIKLLVGLTNVKANLVGNNCLYMLVYREVFMPVLVWLHLLLLAVGEI